MGSREEVKKIISTYNSISWFHFVPFSIYFLIIIPESYKSFLAQSHWCILENTCLIHKQQLVFSSLGRFSSCSQHFSTCDVVNRPKCILRKAFCCYLLPCTWVERDQQGKFWFMWCCSKHNIQSDEICETPSLETFGHIFCSACWSQVWHKFLQDCAPRICLFLFALINYSYPRVMICYLPCSVWEFQSLL